jgi:hypothetical protein
MTRLRFFALVVASISGGGISCGVEKRKGKTVLKQVKMLWNEQIQKAPATEGVPFFLDPIIGLSDIDAHPVTDDGWIHMRAPHPNSVANLAAAPSASLSELEEAIKALTSKGGYKEIEITVRNP